MNVLTVYVLTDTDMCKYEGGCFDNSVGWCKFKHYISVQTKSTNKKEQKESNKILKEENSKLTRQSSTMCHINWESQEWNSIYN